MGPETLVLLLKSLTNNEFFMLKCYAFYISLSPVRGVITVRLSLVVDRLKLYVVGFSFGSENNALRRMNNLLVSNLRVISVAFLGDTTESLNVYCGFSVGTIHLILLANKLRLL